MADYYVSVSGDDANPGTLAAPWRTLQKAFDLRKAGTIAAGSVINVRAGVYREPVYSDASNLIVQGYNGEGWTVDLSMDITGPWTSLGSGVYRTQFTRPANWKGMAYPGVGRVSTRVNTGAGPNERLAYLYVDDTIAAANWLKPQFDGLDYSGPTNLPSGCFATDAPNPTATSDFGGMTSYLWVHLPDNSSPAGHRIRVGKYAQAFYLSGASTITIRNMKLMLVEGNGFYGNCQALTMENCEFALMKNQPMTLWRLSSGHTIRNNWFHDLEYEAIHNESDSSLFENNLIENTLGQWSNYGPVGILTNGINNTIRNNTVRGLKKSQSGAAGFGFYTEQWYSYGDGQPSGTGNIYEGNYVDNNQGGGIWTSGGDNEIIRNNVVVNNGGPGIVVVKSSGAAAPTGTATNDVVYHNTVVNNGWGESWGSGIHLQDCAGANVRDNIVYGNRTPYFQSGDTGTTLANNVTANPLVVNAAGGDYRLTASSPAIDAGANVGITIDRIGTTRPQGGGYDAGAYEYTSTPAPSATVTLLTPLALSASTAAWGQTLTATVTYKNTGTASITIGKIIVGARPPGGTNSGGPFLDFAPESGAQTLAAGASYTLTATKTFASTDPVGTWYAFSTWIGTDSVSHDAPVGNNVAFTVTATTPVTPVSTEIDLAAYTLVPSGGTNGDAATPVTITVPTGRFVSGDVVTVDGVNATTTFISSTQIRVMLTTAHLTNNSGVPITRVLRVIGLR